MGSSGPVIRAVLATTAMLLAFPALAGDSAMYRADAARSGAYPDTALTTLVRQAWVFEAGEEEPLRLPPVAAGGRVFLGAGNDVVALDLRTGKQKWRRPVPRRKAGPEDPPEESESAAALCSIPAHANQKLFFSTTDGRGLALDAATGKQRWSADLTVSIETLCGPTCKRECGAEPKSKSEEQRDPVLQSLPAVSGSIAYLGTGYGGLAAADVKQKKLLWELEPERAEGEVLGACYCSSPAIDDARVYVSRHLQEAPSPAGQLDVLDRESGRTVLEFTVPLPDTPPDPSEGMGADCPDPVLADGYVLFPDGAGKLYALRDLSPADRRQAQQANSKGMRYYRKKQYAEAAAEFRRAMTLDPEHKKAPYNLACMLALQNRADDRCGLCERVLPALRAAAELDPRVKVKAGKDRDFGAFHGSAALRAFTGTGAVDAALLVEAGPWYGRRVEDAETCAWCPPQQIVHRGPTVWFHEDGRFGCTAGEEPDARCKGKDTPAGTFSLAKGVMLTLHWAGGRSASGKVLENLEFMLQPDGVTFTGCPVCPPE